jgi:hypothetical protein
MCAVADLSTDALSHERSALRFTTGEEQLFHMLWRSLSTRTEKTRFLDRGAVAAQNKDDTSPTANPELEVRRTTHILVFQPVLADGAGALVRAG